jgi:pilus assembly protein Flp/PilA
MLKLYTTLQLALTRVFDEEEGQGLTEYALILALIAIVAIAALSFLGGKVTSTLSQIGSSV